MMVKKSSINQSISKTLV